MLKAKLGVCKFVHLAEKVAGTCSAQWKGLISLSLDVWGGVMHHLPDVRIGKEQSVKLSFIAKFGYLHLFQIYTRLCVRASFFISIFLNDTISSNKTCNSYLQNLSYFLCLLATMMLQLLIKTHVDYNLF